jgi:hypothetical protein
VFLFVAWTAVHSQAILQPEVSLDRTAFFVGEPIQYRVRIRHDPGVEFVLDRLDKTSLQLAPFIVQDLQIEQSERGPRHLLTLTIRLVTYEIVQKEWRIPEFNLYYVSRDAAAPPEGRPVQRLTIPAVPVAFRSSLPEESHGIRTEIAFDSFSLPFWTLLTAGVTCLLIVGSHVGRRMYLRLRRPAPEREARSAVESRTRQALDRLLTEHDPQASGASASAFYREMADLLRDYSGSLSESSGPALTAPEVRARLVREGEDPERARRVGELVSLADRLRYGDDDGSMATERLGATRSELQQLFGS